MGLDPGTAPSTSGRRAPAPSAQPPRKFNDPNEASAPVRWCVIGPRRNPAPREKQLRRSGVLHCSTVLFAGGRGGPAVLTWPLQPPTPRRFGAFRCRWAAPVKPCLIRDG